MARPPTPVTGEDALAMRKKRGLNQGDFWKVVGITQSGGSRYESGRNIPNTVQTLLRIAYGSASQKQSALNSLTLKGN